MWLVSLHGLFPIPYRCVCSSQLVVSSLLCWGIPVRSDPVWRACLQSSCLRGVTAVINIAVCFFEGSDYTVIHYAIEGCLRLQSFIMAYVQCCLRGVSIYAVWGAYLQLFIMLFEGRIYTVIQYAVWGASSYSRLYHGACIQAVIQYAVWGACLQSFTMLLGRRVRSHSLCC